MKNLCFFPRTARMAVCRLVCCVTLFLFAAHFSVCGAAGESASPSVRITGILPTKSDGVYWQEIIDGMEQAADDQAAALSVIYTESYDNYPAISLNNALETAILYETDVIILSYSRDADEDTDRLLRRARDSGIRVLLIDNDRGEALRDVYVGIDNEAAARCLASMAQKEMGTDESALLLYSSANSDMENISLRIDGILAAFEENHASSRLFSLSPEVLTEAQQMDALNKFLKEHPDVGTIFTFSERTTIATAQFLAQNDLTGDIRVYGFDYTEEAAALLASGELDVLIGQQQYQMGYTSIVVAVSLASDSPPETDRIFIDFQIYTQDDPEGSSADSQSEVLE